MSKEAAKEATKEAQRLRLQSCDELKVLLLDNRAARFRLQSGLVSKDKNVIFNEMKKRRKTIARIHTIIQEKETSLK